MSFHDSQHATDPGADLDPLTDWQVVSFVDPAGTGSDLAFTRGLSAFDLPELLLWARPTEGLDPGADWLLTHRERSRLLNGWALELITGSLQSGMEREVRFDGGHSVARFRFGPPTLVSPLQHPYLPTEARVICAAWSLLRQATQPPAGLGAAAARRMERWIAAAEAVTRGWRLRPGPLDRPEVRDPTERVWPDQLGSLGLGPPGSDRFGPMTRWVDARIAQVLAADADVVAAFLERLQLAGHARCEDCLLEQLTRLATRSHRNSATREASRVAQELGLTLAGPPGQSTSLWLRAVAVASATPDSDPPTEATLRTTLSDGLEILLVSAVLADVATPSAMASAAGPWEWAVNDHRPPGRLWLARPAIRRAARELLAPATPALLVTAVEHALQSAVLPEGRAVSRLVTGLQTTAGASAQPGALLRRDQGRGLPRSIVRTADQLAGQLLTAMALPYRFPEDSWELLRQSLRPLVPTLPVDLRVEIP
jgi:hypothetical protein